MASYTINKGINKSISYKGIKAQYLVYVAIGMVLLLLLFFVLYALGCSIYVCVLLIVPAAIALISVVQHFSKIYGEYGLLKKGAQKRLPHAISSYSTLPFQQLLNP